MTRFKNFVAPLAVLALTALVLAGCGSNSKTTTTSPAAATQSTSSSGAVTVSTKSSDAGTVLSGDGGKTLYLFEADKNGKPTCSGDCAAAWPPAMTTGDAKASGDADQSKLGTVSSSGGKQITYAGHPLYYFAKDTDAEDIYGNGVEAFGAEWYALTPTGANAEGSKKTSSSSTSNDSSSSSGY
jgi:predicted lipoprotein with Yx(FWY)xxD motif